MTLEQLLDLVIASRLRELHTALPCRVESYDASKQTADVLPMLKRQVPDGEGGYTLEDLPVLPSVPVAFPRGGGFFVSFPLQKGDFVFVVFSERAIGAWRQKGQATTPGDLRMHSLAGAVALPCLYPSDDALDDAHASNMVIGKDGSTAQIHLKSDGTVHLGGENGAQFVALATDVLNRLSAIVSSFNGHQHGETGGTTTVPTVLMSSPASVAASKVKAT